VSNADSRRSIAVVEVEGLSQPVVVPMKHIKECGDDSPVRCEWGDVWEESIGLRFAPTATGEICCDQVNALSRRNNVALSKVERLVRGAARMALSRYFLAISLPGFVLKFFRIVNTRAVFARGESGEFRILYGERHSGNSGSRQEDALSESVRKVGGRTREPSNRVRSKE